MSPWVGKRKFITSGSWAIALRERQGTGPRFQIDSRHLLNAPVPNAFQKHPSRGIDATPRVARLGHIYHPIWWCTETQWHQDQLQPHCRKGERGCEHHLCAMWFTLPWVKPILKYPVLTLFAMNMNCNIQLKYRSNCHLLSFNGVSLCNSEFGSSSNPIVNYNESKLENMK